jgi:hypothetical protein
MWLVLGTQSVAETPSNASGAASGVGSPQSAATDNDRSIATLRNEITELRRKVEKPPKDFWDKVSSVSGFASGIAVALIGFYATKIYDKRGRDAEKLRKEQSSNLEKERFTYQQNIEKVKFNYEQEKEKERFTYQKNLEKIKFDYEQEKWREALSSQVALKLFETRFAAYSCLRSRVEIVASHRMESGELTQSSARELATHVKNWRYSTGGLLAEPTTRDAAYAFQQAVWRYDGTSESYRRIRTARRILRDALRADIGVSEDTFGRSLISVAKDRQQIRSNLSKSQDELGIKPDPDR